MVLGFKPQFKDKILSGSKIHTIREDRNRRWQIGKKIHFATGVRTKKYNQFKEGVCTLNQAVTLEPEGRKIYLGSNGSMELLNPFFNKLFALNDGFENEDDFWEWFNKPFHGVIIHWTNYRY